MTQSSRSRRAGHPHRRRASRGRGIAALLVLLVVTALALVVAGKRPQRARPGASQSSSPGPQGRTPQTGRGARAPRTNMPRSHPLTPASHGDTHRGWRVGVPAEARYSLFRASLVVAIVAAALVTVWRPGAPGTAVLLAAPAVDASSTAAGADASSLTFSHTVGSGSHRLLLVGVSLTGEAGVSGVTYGGAPLVPLGSAINGPDARAEMWALVAPPTGTADVAVTLTQQAKVIAGAASFTGVDQSTPTGAFTTASGIGSGASVTVTGTAAGQVVVDVLAVKGAIGATAGPEQTQRWNAPFASDVLTAASTEEAAGAVATMSWSLGAEIEWALGAVTLNAAPDVDTMPPGNVASYPKAGGVTATTADVLARLNEAGTAYFVVVDFGAPAPSAAQVKAGQDSTGAPVADARKGSIALAADTEGSGTASGLTASTTYDVYVVAEDTSGNLQASPVWVAVTPAAVSTLSSHTNPPNFNSGYPKKGTVTATTAELLVKTNEAGTAYFVVLADGAATPTAAKVKAGQDASGAAVAANRKGSITLAAETQASATISGLQPSTDYDIWVVAEDTDGNLQTSASKVNVETRQESTPGHADCGDADVKSIGGTADVVFFTAPGGTFVGGVCIKSGNAMFPGSSPTGHSGRLDNGTYEGGCYSVSGVGGGSVIVERIGTVGPSCQDLSHIDVYLSSAARTVQFAASSSSGSESTTSANLSVALSTASTQTVTVQYTVSYGTATGGGVDYTLAPGTLTFAPGETSEDIALTVVDDAIGESDESVHVTIFSPENATLGTFITHTYTIADNDGEPSVGFGTSSSSGSEGATPASLAVNLSHASSQTVTVDYAVTGGTATGGGVDYTLAAGTLTFAPGETTKSISLAVVNDAIAESDETVRVTLSNPANSTLGSIATHTYSILDNEGQPSVTFTTSASSGLESNPLGNMTVILSHPSSSEVTVGYSVVGGTATSGGVDYTLAAGTLTFDPGETTKTVQITVVDDALDEAGETTLVALANPTNVELGAITVHTYTILDDDAQPTVSYTTAASSGGESTASKTLTVEISAVSGRTVLVSYAVSGGTAQGGGVDYTLAAGLLVFPPGETARTFDIAVVDDAVYEGAETIKVTLSNPVNATLGGTPTHTYTVLDNEIQQLISVENVKVNGGTPVADDNRIHASAKSTGADVPIEVGQVSCPNGLLPMYVSAVVAAHDGQTYTLELQANNGKWTGIWTAPPGTAGATSKVDIVAVCPQGEMWQEVGEIVLHDPSGIITDSIAGCDVMGVRVELQRLVDGAWIVAPTGQGIIDPDQNPQFSGPDGSYGWDVVAGQWRVVVSANGYETQTSRSVTIPPPVTDLHIDLVPTGTPGAGCIEQLWTNPPPLPPPQPLDPRMEPVIVALPTVSFWTASSAGLESSTPALLVVQLSAASTQTVTVTYTVTGGTASGGGVDYSYTGGTGLLTFAPGETAMVVALDIVDDDVAEGAETVVVTLLDADNARRGDIPGHTYTIVDDDGATPPPALPPGTPFPPGTPLPPGTPPPSGAPVQPAGPSSGSPLPSAPPAGTTAPRASWGVAGQIASSGGIAGIAGQASCAGGGLPSAVTATIVDYDGREYTAPLSAAEGDTWATDWAVPPGPPGTTLTVSVTIVCPEGTHTETVGEITRLDPSGRVYDADSGCGVPGARVELQRFVDGAWVVADPSAREGNTLIMDPAVNPQTTGALGAYGWDVVPGRWRVVVSHPNYVTATSRAVDVPPPVTNLHVPITALSGQADFSCVPGPASTGYGVAAAPLGDAASTLLPLALLALLGAALPLLRLLVDRGAARRVHGKGTA